MTPQWASCVLSRPRRQLRLFAFPYAGGTSAIYRSWPRELPPQVELWTIHLPGRERRIGEPAAASVAALIPPLVAGLIEHFDEPFAFFGHSLGTLLSYELTRRLQHEGLPLPRILILSGHRAPHLPSPRAPVSGLSREELLRELHRLNGTPPEVLAHEELLDLLLPTLKADFAADETYQPSPAPPLDCPINAYGGTDDPDVPRDHIEAWRSCTTGPFSLRMFPGDHFFLHGTEVARQVGVDLMTRSLH